MASETSETCNAVVVTGVCSETNKGFGIRFEKVSRDCWMADWAFAIKDSAAKREGYDKTTINGRFEFAATFPGCPYCHRPSFVKCNCGVISCLDLESKSFYCIACGISGQVTYDVRSLSAGEDR